MFRAHRGQIRHRALLHRGARHAAIKLHAKRGLKARRVKGIKYAGRTKALTMKQARYKSLIHVPSAYKVRAGKQRKPSRYKAAR